MTWSDGITSNGSDPPPAAIAASAIAGAVWIGCIAIGGDAEAGRGTAAQRRTNVAITMVPVTATVAAAASMPPEIAALLDTGPTTEELERSKSRMIADYIYAQDNQATLARQYGAALTTGSTVEAVLARPERLRAVTAEQVRELRIRALGDIAIRGHQ